MRCSYRFNVSARAIQFGIVLGHIALAGNGVAVASGGAATSRAETTGRYVRIPIRQPQVFLDDALVASKEQVVRTWHALRKHPANPVLLPAPWEDQHWLFGTVLREPDPDVGGEAVFRMWYYAAVHDEEKAEMPRSTASIGYAVSRDGLHWEKPICGLYEFNGSRNNNIVFNPVWETGAPALENRRLIDFGGVIRDPRQNIPEDERYKAIIATLVYREDERVGRDYLLIVSPDGIHWRSRQALALPEPCEADRACLVWDPSCALYVLYNRTYYSPPAVREKAVEKNWPRHYGGNARAVAVATSADFKEWTLADPPLAMHVDGEDPDTTQIYGLQAFPCGGQWVGLWQNYCSRADVSTIDVGIAHSRDGMRWSRVRTTDFLALPNGSLGDWDRFNQCTATAPVRVGDELWVYYSGRLYRHGGYDPTGPRDSGPYFVGIGLATLRLDGWCSMASGFNAGEVITIPLILPEGKLYINAQARWGEIQVEVLDESGELIKGMASEPLKDDGVKLPVSWPAGKSLTQFADMPIRLRFTITNARLYSWQVDRPAE